MNKRERVLAVLRGERPDRPPYSFWHHFKPEQFSGCPAIEAHLSHLRKYDLDFLKIMNDTGLPRPSPDWHIRSTQDLDDIEEWTGEEEPFERELEVIRGISKELKGKLLTTVTLFNAWATLRRLCAPHSDHHGPPSLNGADERDKTLTRILHDDPERLRSALIRISKGLSRFAQRAIEAGADGIFLSVRDDWVDTPENGEGIYDSLVVPTDLEILSGAKEGTFNVLHVCGRARHFDRFATYPVHALNWADRYGGPPISAVIYKLKPAIMGGLDNLNTLPHRSPHECAQEAEDALREAEGRPIIVTPGCTYDPEAVPEENLRAVISVLHRAAQG
ncbi:MAG: uroporphyrinogen decarboxylase family protein [Candidatus Caldarchaeum sp.]